MNPMFKKNMVLEYGLFDAATKKLISDIKISDVIYTGDNTEPVTYPEGTLYNDTRDKTKREKDSEKYLKLISKKRKEKLYLENPPEPYIYDEEDF